MQSVIFLSKVIQAMPQQMFNKCPKSLPNHYIWPNIVLSLSVVVSANLKRLWSFFLDLLFFSPRSPVLVSFPMVAASLGAHLPAGFWITFWGCLQACFFYVLTKWQPSGVRLDVHMSKLLVVHAGLCDNLINLDWLSPVWTGSYLNTSLFGYRVYRGWQPTKGTAVFLSFSVAAFSGWCL